MAASNCRTFSPGGEFLAAGQLAVQGDNVALDLLQQGGQGGGAFRLATPRADVNSSRVPSSSKIGLFLGIFIRVMVLARPPSPFFV